MNNKLSFDFGGTIPSYKKKVLENIIVDRKSKYTVVGGYVESKSEVDAFMKELLQDRYYRKATHNTFAYRIKQENGSVLEGRNDDGETGAGNCILRELHREDYVNIVVVVTRYFGGIQLHADRFKNVINATKEILNIN